ncbi:uncharacterized protein [Spinacia oleracea]|uniref:Aspartic peptidase DDI1-type domain-containing protein n=1 Tax=Spinacia oleracea TaxID=3562 RepID=A0ABM3QYC3_SPIOL|nr:uncharacterized protein LOC130463309 [Spinacia oleracea]
MIETQLAQLASTIKEHHLHTSLPPQGQAPRQMNAIVTRSGKTLGDSVRASKVSESKGEEQKGIVESNDNDAVENEPHVDDVSDVSKPKETTLLPFPTPKPPYPQRFIRHKLDVRFSKLFEFLRKLHITIPFTDALKQMPTYSRFLKEILSGKRDCDVKKTVNLTENGSAIILNQMPPKLKDPGSFSIPCAIKTLEIGNSLCDLGASVSLMQYSVFTKLDIGELVPTNITLQLGDRSVKYTIGKVEDVPLRVGKFIIPMDFVVLDIDEDAHVPIILGRRFLATAVAIFDVKQGVITLKVGKDSLTFDLTNTMQYPSSPSENCFFVYSLDPLVHDMHEHLLISNDPLKLAILNRECLGNVGVEAAKYKEQLNTTPLGEECCLLLDREDFHDDLEQRDVLKLIHVLRRNQSALGYTIDDLKDISLTLCMHHIELEDNAFPHRERQRKLNPPMGEVVKKEIVKLLAAGIIYHISNSRWVSPVHVVPKKGGMTVVKNQQGELISTQTVTGWRMCIDYRQLNLSTKKYHFALHRSNA